MRFTPAMVMIHSKKISREIIIFVSSACFLFVSYIFWYCVNEERELFIIHMNKMRSALKSKKRIIGVIGKIVRSMEKNCLEDPRKFSKSDLGRRLKECARASKLSYLSFTFMPENISQQNRSPFIVRRMIINLRFSAYVDSYVWNFLGNIYTRMPGLFFMTELKLERAQASAQAEKELEVSHVLMGHCVFEWISVGFTR
jgi:hypothetical protein